MTSPVQKVEVRCAACGALYETSYRASFNLGLSEEYDDAYVREMTTAACPDCGHVAELESLIVDRRPATPSA